MPKPLAPLLLLLTLIVPAVASKEGPFPGQKALNFTLKSLSGETVELKALYEKGPVWLSLFATWCPDCNKETSDLIAASKKYPDVQFVAVSLVEDKSDVLAFQKKFNVNYPLLLDEEGDVAESYQIRPIPVNLGIQKGGLIVFRRQTVSAKDIEALIPTLFINGEKAQAQNLAPQETSRPMLERLYATLPLLASFLAGLLTFLSPCVLPLIPAYLSFVTGFELENLLKEGEASAARKHLIVSTLFFVLGFGAIFTALGATATGLGQTLSGFQKYLRLGGGALLILFGLHIAGVLRLMPLYKELRFKTKDKPMGYFGAFVVGLVFAVGWTPCVGPILSSILLLSSQQNNAAQGTALLASYSLGIGVPFMLASAFLGKFQGFIKKIRPHFDIIEKATGALLILLGLLLLTNKLTYISGLLPSP